MSERRSKGCLVAAIIWMVILGCAAVAYKFLVHPYFSRKLTTETGSDSRYKQQIVLRADSFSGYAILRSPAVKEELKQKGIKLVVEDDKGDTLARLKALQTGAAQMAAFTVDSLISAGAKLGAFPASAVLVLDETKGSDAIVALKGAVPDLEALNDPAARLVLTPNSPSEFLARVVLAHFDLPQLPAQWWVEARGAGDVLRRFRAAGPTEKHAYVLWEPYVSRALQQPGAQVLLDSAKLQGYVVDVLVAERGFLREQPDAVRAFVEAYCRANYALAQKPGAMADLVREDAKQTGGESLDEAQARQIVAGIQWKNTLENYAHFGLSGAGGELPHLEDIIGNIMDVLLKTRALPADPLKGQHNTLFYAQVLSQMKAAGFHPGQGLNLLPGVGNTAVAETVRLDKELPALTPEQWQQLRPVGSLRTEPITFRRASATLSEQGERDLQALAKRLASFPRFYVRVIGQARAEGDPEANRVLGQARAEAAARYLVAQGLSANRLRTEAVVAATGSGEAQAVSFVVGQVPY